MLAGDTEVELEGFLTDERGARARAFVSENTAAEHPFFLMLAFNAEHSFCWQLPAEELEKRNLPTQSDYLGGAEDYLGWYDKQVSPNLEHGREYYVAQLELMDRQIDKLLQGLEGQGIGDDTLVVHRTDYGGSNRNFADNTPLRGRKYTLWEGGINVPCLMRWPRGGLPAGELRDGPVSWLDLYPTLLAAAGAPPKAYAHSDGKNLLPLLRGTDPATHEALHGDNGFQWEVRPRKWKLSWVDADSPHTQGLRDVEKAEPGLGLRLYDLGSDPGETTEASADHPAVVAKLALLHARWRARVAGSAVDPARS